MDEVRAAMATRFSQELEAWCALPRQHKDRCACANPCC